VIVLDKASFRNL